MRGAGDPTHQRAADGFWRCSMTPEGPSTLQIRREAGEVVGTAWGDGAATALEWLPALLGSEDDPGAFDPAGHPLLVDAVRKRPGLRLGRTRSTWEALAPAVLEQRVTGKEARRAWAGLVRKYGLPAPGPAPRGMYVAPPPNVWRRIPSWEWHKAGVDASRSITLVKAAGVADRLEGLDSDRADSRLRSLPGVGVWTSAEVRQRAHGDPDAISVGDYHLASFVGWALLGEPVDDDAMVELLEPWRGQRQRVVRLLGAVVPPMERRGPRATITDHRQN